MQGEGSARQRGTALAAVAHTLRVPGAAPPHPDAAGPAESAPVPAASIASVWVSTFLQDSFF